MKITGTVDVAPVGSYYGHLALMLRQDLPSTLRMEAAATVRIAMNLSTRADPEVIKARTLISGVANFREADRGFGGTTSVGKRSNMIGMQWMVGAKGGKARPIGAWDGTLGPIAEHTGLFWRQSDADWNKFREIWSRNKLKVSLNQRKRAGAAGLTAKSWFDLLLDLGNGKASAPEMVKRARPISGSFRKVGFVQASSGSASPELTITNTSGIAIKTRGQAKLNSAISRRRNYFNNSLENGFFGSATLAAKKYPWMRVEYVKKASQIEELTDVIKDVRTSDKNMRAAGRKYRRTKR